MILELFAQTKYRPSKIIFVDDKMSNVLAVDKALEKLGIPAICFYYRHIDLHRSFDPVIANIQLEKFIFENEILSDAQATLLKAEKDAHKNPDEFFLFLVSNLKF